MSTAARPSSGWLRVAPAIAVLGWGGNEFLPLMQLYRQLGGFTQVEIDLLLAAYVAGIVPGFALSGPWSDRHGRKPVLFIGVALGVVGSGILALGESSLAVLCVGRAISGVSVAIGMVVGTAWIKELSHLEGRADAGARRAAAVLTIGFGGGAGIGGALAQWAPWPGVLPYVVHICASMMALLALWPATETRQFDANVTSLLGDLRIPHAARREFVRTVLPLAPWVFAAPALAFAVGPSLVISQVGDFAVGFATLVTVVTLAVGWATQQWSGRLIKRFGGTTGVFGAGFTVVGALTLVPAAVSSEISAVLVAAPLFGIGYGLSMVAGLTRVQAMASPDDLAGITAVYYCITYVGFLLPALLAGMTLVAPLWVLLIATATLCAVCALAAAAGLRTDRGRRREERL
ncbi:MFS transporter [Plantibacter sp. M259]|uniref:MFS transporter n=1 Tax=Plantibacter sp. M259 TaxID=2583822 RepID=UPI0011103526|nr:MFS transporter [Plantibacter sp. M259]